MLVRVGLNVVSPSLDGGFDQVIDGKRGGWQADFALAVKLIGNTAESGNAAAVFSENRAQVGGAAVEVVGGHLDDEGDAGGAVALISDFLDGVAAEFAAAFFDGALDIFAGSGDGFGEVDGAAQAGIGRGITAAGAGSQGDFMGTLAEDPAFDGIDSGFDVFDL